ncbi:unnamed protein product [Ectocarpus sp. CCAP 1310/34]|nr:unnamed protein product [Ectocarpus sp. CCAP 1310/34]
MASTTCHKMLKTVSLDTPNSTATSRYEAPAIIRKPIASRIFVGTAPRRYRFPVSHEAENKHSVNVSTTDENSKCWAVKLLP